MNSIWFQLALVAVLVGVNALFAGTEMALVSLRDSQVDRLAERGARGRALAKLAGDPNQFLATIQIGITLAGFLASATAAVSLAEPLIGQLERVVGAAARPVAIVLVTMALTFVTLVLGELAPKRIAMHRTEGWALAAARPLSLLASAARPVVWLLGASSDLAVRAVGIDPDADREEISEEELRHLVAAQPELTDVERDIIDGAFEFADRTLQQIVVPRAAVVTVTTDAPVADVARTLATSGHTRAPVHTGDLDQVVGTIHLRALVDAVGTAGEHIQPVLLLPETVGCLDALRTMQAERQQMVIVIDEHGSTQGIVTVEDLLEELVGEIWDEADPDVQAVQHHPDGSMTLDGTYPIHDLTDLGIEVPEGPYTTVAGLVMATLGHVPTIGEHTTVEGWRLEVVEATDRAVTRVLVYPPLQDVEPGGIEKGSRASGPPHRGVGGSDRE